MSILPQINPVETEAWQSLTAKAEKMKKQHLKSLFEEDNQRFENFHLRDLGMLYDFSKTRIDLETMDLLFQLAEQTNLAEAMQAFKSGKAINETEKRKVLHTALRTPANKAVLEEEKWAVEVRNTMRSYVDKIHSGKWTAANGQAFTHVVNIGIGGSYLGPRFLNDALRLHKSILDLHFISNVDPQNLQSVIEKVPLETTLFVIVSKSFGTIETLSNATAVKEVLKEKLGADKDLGAHFLTISSNVEKAVAWGLDKDRILPLPDWAGGRFSVWGSVGIGIALAYGMDMFEEVLQGASEMDDHFFNSDPKQNLPIMMALLSIWNTNFLGINNKVLVPYDALLGLFPAYLQQMIMESNGKSVGRSEKWVNYQTSPIYWGETGTDAQHSFFQLLHQGTVDCSIDFMLPANSKPTQKNLLKILQYNCLAQSAALAFGQENNDSSDPLSVFRQFPGNTSSTTLIYDELSPAMVGKLTALYEHMTFVQGAIWNIFSFDQWGVELGKKLANDLENGEYNNVFDSSTEALKKHLSL